MNSRQILKFFTYVATLALTGPCLASTHETAINKFDIKSCHQKKCIVLKSDRAVVSQFSSIYSFNKYEIEYSDGITFKKNDGASGYIDFDQELIVLYPARGIEMMINLKTMEEREFF